jgi:hypothetical protein
MSKLKEPSVTKELLFPVYEFRPHESALEGYGPLLRLEGNEWIPDDGGYGLAFSRGNVCLYVSLPYQRNIIWSWVTGHWADHVSKHPRGNAWHYMLREGESEWGGNWGSDYHPNSLAGKTGMSLLSAKHSCANGRHVEFNLRDKHILAGLLRERDTKAVVRFPEKIRCMYCGDDAASLVAACTTEEA